MDLGVRQEEDWLVEQWEVGTFFGRGLTEVCSLLSWAPVTQCIGPAQTCWLYLLMLNALALNSPCDFVSACAALGPWRLHYSLHTPTYKGACSTLAAVLPDVGIFSQPRHLYLSPKAFLHDAFSEHVASVCPSPTSMFQFSLRRYKHCL